VRIESLTIALRLPGVHRPIVNEKIGNRQFWTIDSLTIGSLTIALRLPGVHRPIVNEKIGNRQFW
jgi:hypothetical protein